MFFVYVARIFFVLLLHLLGGLLLFLQHGILQHLVCVELSASSPPLMLDLLVNERGQSAHCQQTSRRQRHFQSHTPFLGYFCQFRDFRRPCVILDHNFGRTIFIWTNQLSGLAKPLHLEAEQADLGQACDEHDEGE